jgi:predicted nucleotidyltransferase
MTELELLAKQVGTNERTLRRALSQGTLRAERPTPRKLEISAAEKRYLRRSWRLLATLRAALRTEQNVRFALLFGSAARGEDSPASDVDLLVEMRDPSLARIADLEAKLEGLIGRRVDVLTLDDARGSNQLLAEALTEGRVLVDREDRWPQLRDEVEALRRRARDSTRRARRRALEGIDRMLADRAG